MSDSEQSKSTFEDIKDRSQDALDYLNPSKGGFMSNEENNNGEQNDQNQYGGNSQNLDTEYNLSEEFNELFDSVDDVLQSYDNLDDDAKSQLQGANFQERMQQMSSDLEDAQQGGAAEYLARERDEIHQLIQGYTDEIKQMKDQMNQAQEYSDEENGENGMDNIGQLLDDMEGNVNQLAQGGLSEDEQDHLEQEIEDFQHLREERGHGDSDEDEDSGDQS